MEIRLLKTNFFDDIVNETATCDDIQSTETIDSEIVYGNAVINPIPNDLLDDGRKKQSQSKLEKALSKIKLQLDYSLNVSECVVEKLKQDLKTDKKEALKFIHEYFGDMLDDEGFIRWLANRTGYTPIRFIQMLKENRPNKRNSKFSNETYQEIYDFWLANSINSNESAYNMKRISKREYLEQYSSINDTNLIEKTVQLKNGSKVVFTSPRMVYTESARKLHVTFNEKHTPVSLSLFFRYKPYYCVRPSEKEKSSCLCKTCLNPHLYLKSINIYRKSKSLSSHPSLTEYINRLDNGEDFVEATDTKLCKYYYYDTVTESYIGKQGIPIKYTRTARVDDTKPVLHLVKLIRDESKNYLKHRTYVDNCSNVFPLMKDAYDGKYIELDFSQNIAIRPKFEVQSAHFSNKQYTLHSAIATPFERKYHYHLSDDTKHDGMFVDQVLRDLIAQYNIANEDLWIQSDNAPSQYKNKHSFRLLQSLANEFNLRIIRTYGAAGHGKELLMPCPALGSKIF